MFIEQEGSSELQIMTAGKYGGVGMRIAKRDGWATVVEPPFEGTPSQKAGIREGDRIIEVDGHSTEPLNISETAQKLRGEIGTEVNIKISRVGEERPLEFRLIRAEIKVSDITYAGIIQDKIGYIRLSHFSRFAGKQVHDSLAALTNRGIESLIFDLRGNPGGLLESAVEVAENFIKKGDMIVYTKGRGANTDKEYRSETEPVWGDKPLVVLVDSYSASASEIVSGAIQDLDRGVIIGTPTFGKGLVQTVIPLTRDGNSLKITSAKYYIPSGRLIQKPNFMREKDIVWGFDTNADSSTKKEASFHTAANREVTGGGGIVPDIQVDSPELSPLVINLIMKSMFFNFALEYASQHEDLTKDFVIDDQLMSSFQEFLKVKDFSYRTEAEEHIDALAKIIKNEKYNENVTAAFDNFRNSLIAAKEKDFERDREIIRRNLHAEIAAKFWGTKGKYESEFQYIPEIQKAIAVLKDHGQYFSLLHEKKSGS